jgi:hypothetical protein
MPIEKCCLKNGNFKIASKKRPNAKCQVSVKMKNAKYVKIVSKMPNENSKLKCQMKKCQV